MCLLALPAHAKYSGGTGEPNDPYQIATAADLIALGETPGDYDKHFILTADIDLDPNLPGRRVFDRAVIAPDTEPTDYWPDFQGLPFTGVFDGNGHRVLHLTIIGDDYLGLFGQLGGLQWNPLGQWNLHPGCVQNLGVVDVDIAGSSHVGGLAGCNYGGTIATSYSSGSVEGGGYCIGGLVGGNVDGDVIACCSSAEVTGDTEVGGLAGYIDGGGVIDCYSTGAVTGNRFVGGLVGYYYSSSIYRSYSTGRVSGNEEVGGLAGRVRDPGRDDFGFWDTQTSGQATSAGGTGKTTAEMQTAQTFLDAGWDFVGETANGTDDIWWIDEGKDYPRLSWQGPAGMVFVDIPAGMFEMGDHEIGGYRNDQKPVHTVMLDGFQMSKYETTNAQYAEYLNAAMADGLIQVINGVVCASSDANLTRAYCDTYSSSSYSQIEYSQGRFTVRSRDGLAMSDHPVARVSWYGATAFCDYYGYRLPTEAEWEYAARGGYHDPYYRYPWGSDDIDCSKANCKTDEGFCNPLGLTSWPYTVPVGYYGPQGPYGLCDMSGNLWEWCQDWYDAGYYAVSPTSNPAGPEGGTTRVLRGGAWDVHGDSCHVADRSVADPLVRGQVVGFRVCR
jgi:formylglycine-generating enzyme required for sulfatase activity